jgi:ribulose bisphosphate carboxylase small subunit
MKTSDILKQFVIAVEHAGAKLEQEVSWRRMRGKAETSTTEDVLAVMQSITKIINGKRQEAIEAELAAERAAAKQA